MLWRPTPQAHPLPYKKSSSSVGLTHNRRPKSWWRFPFENETKRQGVHARGTRNVMKRWIRKLLLLDLAAGLRMTFRQQKPSKIYTEQYPSERPEVAERYRGAPRLNINPDNGETLCIACDLCAVACPEKLILVGSERDPKTKHKVLTTFTYDLSRCMFCGLCEDACPVDAIELTQDFELATYTRQGLIWDRQMLEEGPRPTPYRH